MIVRYKSDVRVGPELTDFWSPLKKILHNEEFKIRNKNKYLHGMIKEITNIKILTNTKATVRSTTISIT